MENKKKSLWQFFQMLGKTFMFPIALLSVCGMLLGIGSAFTNSSLIEAVPLLGNPVLQKIFSFMTTLGLFAFNNLGVLFAMAIPLGLLKEEKEFGAFTGLVSFMAMHIGTNFYLTITDQLAAADKMTEAGQGMILGIQTYNTSVLGGIIAGLLAISENIKGKNTGGARFLQRATSGTDCHVGDHGNFRHGSGTFILAAILQFL